MEREREEIDHFHDLGARGHPASKPLKAQGLAGDEGPPFDCD
jgi:hypothetical protein